MAREWWRLLGILSLNCSEYVEESDLSVGSVISMPSSRAAFSQAFFASTALTMTSSMVSAQVRQPGRSGYNAVKPHSSVVNFLCKIPLNGKEAIIDR